MRKALETYVEAVEVAFGDILHNMDLSQLELAAQCIVDAKSRGNRTHVTGIGKPSYVAGYGASLMSSTGTPAYVLDGTEAVHGSSGQVVSGDVVIAISNSGETFELKETIKTLLGNGAIIISITRSYGSWLSKHSSITLKATVEQEGGPLGKAPRTSILAEMTMLQALSVILQDEADLDETQYLKWHPGGALGGNLK